MRHFHQAPRRGAGTGLAWAPRQWLLAAILAAAGVACSAPQFKAPVVLPDSFSRSGAVAAPARWWRDLDDPALNELIESALAHNFDLLVAWDRLAQARAIARREGAALIPSVDFETSATSTDLTDSAQQGSGVGGRNDTRIGVVASYEIDLWGRIRSTRDAARLDSQATRDELHTAALTLSAEIAKTWYELIEQRRLLDIADQQLHTNEQTLELITLRFRRGLVGASDVLRQRQLVEATRGDRLATESRERVLEHQVAILVGRPPGSLTLPDKRRFAPLPSLPATGLPAEVIDRRPDVQQAYAALLAADRRLAAAKADRYPRLTLSGSAALAAEDLRDLLDNWIATIVAGLVTPLIDGGRRSAEIERVRALLSERLHQYGQAILVSLREVENALVQEEQQRRINTNLDAQLETAQAVLDRIGDQYVHGSIEYLDVLQALVSQQNLQRTRTTAQRQLLGFRIDLYRAIGGAFPLERPTLATPQPREEST